MMDHSSKSSSTSHDSEDDEELPPTTSRPKAYTAATVIPTLPIHTASASSQSQRNRARTSAARPSPTPDVRRRSGTTGHPRPPPLNLGLASLALNPRSPRRFASDSAVPRERPSSPIPIPPRRKERSPPTTPLTARARSPINFFGFHHTEIPRPHISSSLTPFYTTGTRKIASSHREPVVQRGFATMNPRPGSPLHQCTPTSPLSPSLPVQRSSNIGPQNDRRPAKSMLHIAGLPKFHPANFPSRDSSPAVSSPRTSRSVTSQPRAARGSDAQQKLQQYQREVIASATQSSRSMLSDNLGPKPGAPQLTPLRSPNDPMTPLALEGGDDYLQAGTRSLSSRISDGEIRARIEQIVRQDNEGRNHPEARSTSVSPALSPALSPVLSPALSPA